MKEGTFVPMESDFNDPPFWWLRPKKQSLFHGASSNGTKAWF
jgi:hypothetical protein